jgi:aminopeptidase N
MTRLTPATLLCLAAFVRAAHADTYPRQPGVDALHYVFRLELGDESDEIVGDATVRVRFTAGGVNEIVLDLASVEAGKGMTVSQVLAAGAPVRFTHEDNRLRIALNAPPADGEAALTIRYRGVPADGLRFLANIHGDRTMFSENWPNHARQWLPMIDHPYDKATGELIVTAPARYQVVSNGLLVEEHDLGDGRRRTHWKQAVPIASWLYALGVARFAVHHAESVRGIPLQSWAFPQDREKAYALFEPTARRAIEFFDERIGRYSYEKLANVQAAGVSGATEHATAIFYSEKALEETIVVHEVAHQWWGNAVTERDWDDVWLSEGFATYFTLLYTEHVNGRDAFVAGLKNSRDRILELERRMPDTPVVHRNLSDMRRVLNQFVYQKGGWILHMLRGLVGTDVFWNGIRDYYRRYRDQNASTDDFRRVMEGASGKDLEWYFAQWLTRSGVPRVEGSWRYDRPRRQVEVSLAQSQPGEVYRLPVDIGIVPSAGARPRIERVELRDRSAMFSFAADREPASVVLDPGTSLLMDAGPFGSVGKE